MAIPDYQTLMRPVLEEILQRGSTGLSALVEGLADKLNISKEEREQRVKNGSKTMVYDRITWSLTNLYKAGLVDRPSRAMYSISKLGEESLKEHQIINVRVLMQYPMFLEWKNKEKKQTGDNSSNSVEIDVESTQTPQEILDNAYTQLEKITKQELLDRIIKSPPEFLEQIILDLLIAMGYGGERKDASQRLGKTSDGGIDGIIKEDVLGLDVVYVQAKRYQEDIPVPISHVRDFAGSLQAKRANKGVFVTTSYFSKDANDFVSKVHSRIILIDGDELAKLLYEHGIGVRLEMRFDVKKIDEGYFSD